ncbi:tRNA (guanosine(46)-N7)-methyltransferase TrmB [Cyclobacterium amurskyense]|uniref:tRNA (guanine-N(7)-)-methyltransferase n=1 Tax=Cyclobacterium amurskyense TaxID=320787 RepID=A0A0H4PHB7_9BACT|nr:tRNA (guanosine(46)-N7)-methyltransferase TrmB [Cyclobacterium amurskyense]AKP53564.1 tRNA (guanine-N(7)-)-methyltransferase [Cyclobacterium amurskyense]|tara:strand:+ start:1650 stop:2309 length:660 start_codon:yes stop_codon:yes gene_type:complete
MGRNKLERFRQIEENTNVIQPGKEIFEKIKGNWKAVQFQNEAPLVVELACGRGEFTVGQARVEPEKNYVGVDIKGGRIWKGSSIAIAEGLKNVAFLRTQIELIEASFEVDEIDELWITFPDPRPKDRDERKRLTAPKFLEMYKKIMTPGGHVHFKTDNTGLYEYTFELLNSREDIVIFKNTRDFYMSEWKENHHGIMTRYEKMFMEKGETIKYIEFGFK